MCSDAHGNIYSLNLVSNYPLYADTFYRPTDAFTSPANLLITSYDCSGRMRWAKYIGSSGGLCYPYGIVADSLGYIYVAGFLPNGTLSIGADKAITYTYQAEGLIQLDTTGHFNWLRYVGDNSMGTYRGRYSFGSVLALDGLNNVHFLNYTKHGVPITPMLTSIGGVYDLSYNPSGTLLSALRLGMDSTWYLNSAVIDPATNKLYVSGEINPSIFGGYLIDTFYAAAFDASRNLLWQHFAGHGGDDYLSGLTLDQNKKLHFCGGSQSASFAPNWFSFNGDSVLNTHYTYRRMSIIMTTDTNGHPLWIKHFDGSLDINSLNAITQLPNGKIAASGTFVATVTDGTSTITSSTGEAQNPFVVIVDSAGDLQSMQQIHGNGFYDGSYSITSDRIGNIYVGGYVEDSIWAGSPVIPAYHSHGGNTDFYVMKYGVDCSCTSMPVATYTDTGTHTLGVTYTGTTSGLDSVLWTFGDGATGRGLTALHTYTLAGTYRVCATVYTTCGNDIHCSNVFISCGLTPVASFTDTGMITIGTTYTGGTSTVDSIVWSFGDGSRAVGSTVLHTYAAIGTYTVCFTSYSHCGNDTACTVHRAWCLDRPTASFTDTGVHTVGATYTGTTSGVDSIVWYFGDGARAVGSFALHTYSVSATYNLCVVAYSHCGNDTSCNNVVITLPVLGLQSIHAQNQLSVYPNPAKNELNVIGIIDNTQYTVFNATGIVLKKGVLDTANSFISMQALPPGIYVLELNSDSGQRNIVRVVKE